MDNTPDENIRYYGSNPNNYVSFNNELWRIIGVFDNNVKLVRKDSLGKLSWDSSDELVNSGSGINRWGESTYEDGSSYEGANLQVYLNKMYYGGDTTITCYGSANNGTKTCPNGTIDETSKSLIDNHTWNIGAPNYSTLYDSTTKTLDTVEFYQAERGSVNGKICSSGNQCNDIIIRTSEWTGYIGLPYVTDWAYASSESVCETNMQTKDDLNVYICKNNNWMHYGSTSNVVTWMLSPNALPVLAVSVWGVFGVGSVYGVNVANPLSVFPTIYLKSNILIESGKGTSSDPYILKAGA